VWWPPVDDPGSYVVELTDECHAETAIVAIEAHATAVAPCVHPRLKLYQIGPHFRLESDVQAHSGDDACEADPTETGVTTPACRPGRYRG
jgi:hypothetical protein